MPSVMSTNSGVVAIGNAAKAAMVTNSTGVVYDVKRYIGLSYTEFINQMKLDKFTYKIENENEEIKIKSIDKKKAVTVYTPTEVLTKILSQIKLNVQAFTRTSITNCVIAIPANFGEKQRDVTRKAAHNAGLNVLYLINEPTAAAIAFGTDKKVTKDQNILVYDFGGGTFDCTILQVVNGNFRVLASEGERYLGGRDLEERLFQYFREMVKEDLDFDIASSSRVKARFIQEIEKAKKCLSATTQVTLEIDTITPDDDFSHDFSRAKLETLIRPFIEKTIKIVESTIKNSGIKASEIDEVVMVGGSSRIPMAKAMMQ